ncbi:hypothetical protein HNR42_002119 [Deinobacterium chartae]|uniref:Uncharacterized protein n=1 Tax=Deinobacterium chartae TaxID=521158 RepID=A0A841I127_9DEIO|nr:hypothetical protein [Deinobacterium chartae]MBB6098684.1 hypothetical protein [Deinobacterium chartae]
MFERFSTTTIKRGLLLFWALWLTVVVITNLLDALRALELLPASFALASGNYRWILDTVKPLGLPVWLSSTLFAGVIVWEALAATLFWRALIRFRDRPMLLEAAAVTAFVVNLALWAAFQVLDEVVLAFGPEGVHRAIFGNALLTLLVFYLLPARSGDGRSSEASRDAASVTPRA